MNQAILNLIDKKIEETIRYWISTDEAQYFRILWRKLALTELREEISSLPSDTQWIDVKDELPKDWKIVLINEWWIVIHWYNEWGTMYKLPTDKLSYCTHWMPLPLPPNN